MIKLNNVIILIILKKILLSKNIFNSFIRDYFLLKTVDSRENTSMRYKLIESNEIILPSKMENSALMMYLYNLFHNDFDEFDKKISAIIYND